MAVPVDGEQSQVGTLKQQLERLFEEALNATVPAEEVEPLVASCNPRFGDYQCNNAMSVWTKIKGKASQFTGPQPIGKAIMGNLPASDMIESCSIAGPGFVNVVLSKEWLAKFSMLIKFLFEKILDLDAAEEQAIEDLEAFYKASKQRFDSDPEVKERTQRAVVLLQGGDVRYLKAWAQIYEISHKVFERVYQRLGVKLGEKGESFYNPYIHAVVEELNTKGLIEESQGAHVIFIERKKVPFIVVKSDGGFNYASIDLTVMCNNAIRVWTKIKEKGSQFTSAQQVDWALLFVLLVWAGSEILAGYRGWRNNLALVWWSCGEGVV